MKKTQLTQKFVILMIFMANNSMTMDQRNHMEQRKHKPLFTQSRIKLFNPSRKQHQSYSAQPTACYTGDYSQSSMALPQSPDAKDQVAHQDNPESSKTRSQTDMNKKEEEKKEKKETKDLFDF